jgi:hypothetical protein
MMVLPRRLLLVTAATAAAGLLAACGSRPAAPSSPGPPSSVAPSASPAPNMATGLLPAPRGLTDRLALQQTHVTAGTSIKGTLIVTYRGHAPINLNHGCRPAFAVVVANHRFPPSAAFAADCSAAPFIIKPGVNRLPFTVQTRYQACTQAASQATRNLPACLDGRQLMPPLPVGRYEAVLDGDGRLPLPAPAPVPVVLVSASGIQH